MVVMLLLLNPAATQVWVARRICVPIKLGTTHCVGVAVAVAVAVGVAVGVDVAVAVAVAVAVGVALGATVAVGVGVGDCETNSLSVNASCWEAPAIATRPSTHEVACLTSTAEP